MYDGRAFPHNRRVRKCDARITGGADVSDPWGGSLDDYRKVAAYLEYACGDVYDAALKAVRAQTGGTA